MNLFDDKNAIIIQYSDYHVTISSAGHSSILEKREVLAKHKLVADL